MHGDDLDSRLMARAESWIEGDPDPETRSALGEAVEKRDMAELEAAVGHTLTFGTAGIRGEVGPGPGRMNAAMVIKTTAGLANYLRNDGREARPVVLGFDARPSSRDFAELAAGVLAAAGYQVLYFAEVTPTPLVAFTAKDLAAGAAIVITASHNPPADNGYKVYGANAAQIISPEDEYIAAAIEATPPANEVPLITGVFTSPHPMVQTLGEEPFSRYSQEVNEARPSPQQSEIPFVYTAMHGVGGRFVSELLFSSGHLGMSPVPAQFDPDGTFPTVRFPNPEEDGALDLAFQLAEEVGARALIANDPDADRLGAAVAYKDGWRQLSGNELGALLGDYVLRNWHAEIRPIVANSIVSSPILEHLARHHEARHTATLTGFKWIVNAALSLEERGEGRFAFGFEEALGYSVGRTVRDKDGISAALVFIDLVAEEHRAGRTVVDRLHDIWSLTGLWVSTQLSLVRPGVEGADEITDAMRRLGDDPPAQIGAVKVTEVLDYRQGGGSRERWLGEQNLIEMRFGERGRVLARPSGTEPKLKIYVDLAGEPGPPSDGAQTELQREADRLAAEVAESLGL